ncbi:ABC transporter permease [Schaalia naturae]|uniref:ABC transporter permease n=1 Tax=Schaalia naturae TaxID=635203 RepID=A0ABW2SRH1_9ACTO
MDGHRRMYLRMITQSFWHRASRVLIASLSIAVGATTLSCLGLVAYAVPAQMARELRSYGANMVVLPDGAASLSADQLDAADRAVGDAALGRAAYQYANLLYNQQAVQVMGTDIEDALSVRPYWEIDGSAPTGADEILVGESVADLYRFSVGEKVGLTEPTTEDGAARQLTVTGILRTGGAEDDLIVTNPQTLAEFTGGVTAYDVIEYSVDADGADLAAVADAVGAQGTGMEAEVVRRVSESESGVAQTLQTLIWIVSVIICLLTLISISATLSAVVSERAREIGLKKALGALARDVMGEFVGESVLLGLLGGAVGAALGVWIADEISMRAFAVQIGVNWWVVPLTLVFSVAVALVGSLLPARRISAINPVDVLGGE